MKKVAFFLCSNTIGGHEYQSVEILLTAQHYCVPTLFLNIPQHIDLIKDKNIKYIQPSSPFFKRGNFVLQLFYAIKDGAKIRELASEYDQVVICAGTVEAGICCGYALRKKIIYQYVPMFVDRKQLWGSIGSIYNNLLKIFIAPYKGIITINRIQGRVFSKFKRVFIIPNKIGETNISSLRYGKNSNKRLYFVGRLESQKRLVELIKWLDHPDNKFSEFVIVGDGGEKSRIISEIENVKHIKVDLRGWLSREEQDNEFSSDDVFIINSAYEGEPLVIREANNRGSFVIARDIIGHRGSTNKQNRYNDQESLLNLLFLAYNGKLKKYSNLSINEIEIIRENVIKQIFI